MSIRKFERFFPEEYIQPSGCLPFKKTVQTLFALHLVCKIKHATERKYLNPNQKNQVKGMDI
jgi:hypothetical protein